MLGFELLISGVGSNCSTNWAITTALNLDINNEKGRLLRWKNWWKLGLNWRPLREEFAPKPQSYLPLHHISDLNEPYCLTICSWSGFSIPRPATWYLRLMQAMRTNLLSQQCLQNISPSEESHCTQFIFFSSLSLSLSICLSPALSRSLSHTHTHTQWLQLIVQQFWFQGVFPTSDYWLAGTTWIIFRFKLLCFLIHSNLGLVWPRQHSSGSNFPILYVMTTPDTFRSAFEKQRDGFISRLNSH